MGGGGGGGGGPNRRVRVSKAMSWLLRHGAHKEGIPIDEQGYVNVADMLKWHKMRKELNVTFEEVLEEVRNNDKQRFALLHIPPEAILSKPQATETEEQITTAVAGKPDLAPLNNDQKYHGQLHSEEAAIASSQTASFSATARALESAFSTSNPDPSHFLIRATQGHSIKTVAASAYLTPITLDNPPSIPETVVHGTFYAAWDAILRTGGLKPMGRVHVHFATGPSLQSVLDASAEGEKESAAGVLREEKAVTSGMRSDAQILIYVNIRKALQMGIPFWTSENGVVLSEGVPGSEGKDKRVKVPMECWDVAVEVNDGLGVLWRDGQVVKELPEHLKKMGWPHRKEKKGSGGTRAGGHDIGMNRGDGKKARGNGRRDKPKLRIERNGDDDLG